MNLEALTNQLSADPRLERLVNGRAENVDGVKGCARSLFYAALHKKVQKPLLVISQDAEPLANDIRSFSGKTGAFFFPSWDTFPTEDISPSKEVVGERLAILSKLLRNEPVIVTAKIKSAATSVIPKEVLLKNTVNITEGKNQVNRDELIRILVRIGYKRHDIVGERGEFSVKGGIIDIFPSDLTDPIRLEYAGDNIESIRRFDAGDQRSKSRSAQISIFPMHELVTEDGAYNDGIEIKIPEIYPGFFTLFEYFDKDAFVILDDPDILKLDHGRFTQEVEELRSGAAGKFYLEFDEIELLAKSKHLIRQGKDGEVSLGYGSVEDFHGDLDAFADRISGTMEDNSVLIVSKQAQRLYELLTEKGIPMIKTDGIKDAPGHGAYMIEGELYQGLSGNRTIIFTDREIFGKLPSQKKYAPAPKEGVSKNLLADLKPGDLVVHANYGIGIYKGLQKLTIDNALQEYIQIDYADEDKLFVPLHQMGLVEKYSGGGDHIPRIAKLGTSEWAKVRSKAKKSIKDMTEELLKLYSDRRRQEGVVYAKDQLWQAELEKSFQYEETPDQEKAITEIKKEMESGKLIDRLVCGDVGYGKTEVALRAAFKTVMAGRQVAILTPTTILADQHYRTFRERFVPYPVVVDMLSRFKSRDEQKHIIKSLEAGAIDVVIGTHRLLQKDIKFKDLGLIVIDEEHKFGVAHKEKLKALQKGVNVITLSATPIPRTLYMALSGVREISVISTPPLDRSPVRTYLREWSENLIKEAVLREIERGGQVYFVHNIVKSIHKAAALLSSLIPEAKVAVAHGQMDEKELEVIMAGFVNGEYDVLVSTSIIESGLDIPSVNTVMIDHAENFGLAQLYQIRGRVGRSSTRAFAYLLYHKEKVLTETALDRLKAIQEFTALGSGYKLAMADLEIRGAGNLLGAQQHGQMLNVGFDLYCDLLEESVRELKHIEIPPSKRVLIDLKLDAFIPEGHVADDKQRIALYRRMNSLNTLVELDDLIAETVDRFGKVPAELASLFRIIRIKIIAGAKGVTSIIGGAGSVEIKFESKRPVKIDPREVQAGKWIELLENTIKKLPNAS